MQETIVSIVIPLFNKEQEIKNTLESVLTQSFQNFEIIIIDDGSTDRSLQVIKENFNDSRIKIFTQENSGVGGARNHGLRKANGQYIAFIDADDEWDMEYLSTQVRLSQKYKDCKIFGTCYRMVDRSGKINIARIDTDYLNFDEEDGVIPDYFELANHSNPPLWTSAVMVEKKAIEEIGGFPLGVKSGEDLLTWAKLACRNKIAYCVTPLACYNQGHSNPRPPEKNDIIGKELEILRHQNPQEKSLKEYTRKWSHMRMCRFLGYRMYSQAFKVFLKLMSRNPFDLKIYHSVIKFGIIGLKG